MIANEQMHAGDVMLVILIPLNLNTDNGSADTEFCIRVLSLCHTCP